MKPKSLIPWLIAVAMLGAAAFLYSANSAKEAELVKLRADSQQAAAWHTELEQLKTTGTRRRPRKSPGCKRTIRICFASGTK